VHRSCPRYRRGKAYRERTRLVAAEGCCKNAVTDCGIANRLFLPIDLARAGDALRERQLHILLRLAVEFHQAHDHFVAELRFLHREHADAWIAELQERIRPAERTLMTGRLEGVQRSVEPLRLPVRLRIAPSTGVNGEAVDELMVAEVLCGLVRIAGLDPRGAKQRQPQGVVRRLV